MDSDADSHRTNDVRIESLRRGRVSTLRRIVCDIQLLEVCDRVIVVLDLNVFVDDEAEAIITHRAPVIS